MNGSSTLLFIAAGALLALGSPLQFAAKGTSLFRGPFPCHVAPTGLQITALERGIEPDLIGQRIAELREAKDAAEIELRSLTPAAIDSGPDEDPAALLARIPNLAHALQQAPPEIKRQVFDAFGLQITYDKTARRSEISATITEAIAEALHNAEDLPEEVSSVAHRDIAGAGFEPATFGL